MKELYRIHIFVLHGPCQQLAATHIFVSPSFKNRLEFEFVLMIFSTNLNQKKNICMYKVILSRITIKKETKKSIRITTKKKKEILDVKVCIGF